MSALPGLRGACLILALFCSGQARAEQGPPVPQATDPEVPAGSPQAPPDPDQREEARQQAREEAQERMLDLVRAPPGRAMLRAGLGVFIGAYSAAYLTGTMMFAFELQERQDRSSYPGSVSRANYIDSTPDVGSVLGGTGALWIPVAGPLIGAIVYRQPAWSIPIALIDGSAQLTGLVLMIVGARTEARSKALPGRARLLPQLSPGGGGLMVTGGF